MNTNFLKSGLLAAAVALVGCTHTGTAGSNAPQGAARVAVNDPSNRRQITGSNIPQPVNQPTISPTYANIPPTSMSRHPDSVYPTEPVVGANGDSNYRLKEGSTGAGPAGSNPNPGSSPSPTPGQN